MNMITSLTKLCNTMATIETKGENTIIMADCLLYVKNLIKELNESANQNHEED